MTTYTLHVPTWRRGSQTFNSHGHTFLLNKEGYMCCLGQFAEQAGIPREYLLNTVGPSSLNREMESPTSYDPSFVQPNLNNTPLTNRLMQINDDDTISDQERVRLISEKLAEHGHSLIVEDPNGELA